MIKVGVVGVGSMGFNHARIYSEMRNVELVAIFDPNLEASERVARTYNTTYENEIMSLINYHEIDAVSIVTPTSTHYEIAKKFIENGIHVLIEKPVTKTNEEALELIRLAEENKVITMVGHIERFNPAIMKLKEIVGSNELGKIITCSIKRVGLYPPRINDVGIILDLGIHDIDLMNYLFNFGYNKIKNINTMAGKYRHSKEDYAVILLEYTNGEQGIIQTNWLTPYKKRTLEIIGSEGMVEVDLIEQSLQIITKERKCIIKVAKEEPLKNELDYFIDCIKNKVNPTPSLEEGNNALLIALQAQNNKII